MSDFDNAGVKAVLTVGVLGVVGVMAVVIAKIVQVCMNKHYTEEDESDISETTRDLIRARLSVIQFKKREIKKAQKERTLNVFKKWSEIVKSRKKDRVEALKSQRPQGNDQVVITIEHADDVKVKENGALEHENGKIQENGTPRIARFPSFTHTKPAGGAAKPQSETHRPSTPHKVTTIKQESPVPRGRPVTSKSRVLPNVTLTDVDVNNSAKVHIKSVHFEDDKNKVKVDAGDDNKSGEKT